MRGIIKILLLGFLGLLLWLFLSPLKSILGEQITATIRPNPLAVKVSTTSPILVNNRTAVKAEVKNQGPYWIKNTSATLYLPSGLRLISGDKNNFLGAIPSGNSKTTSWRIQALEPGNYIILVEAKGIDQPTGATLTASGSTLFVVKSSAQRFWDRIR